MIRSRFRFSISILLAAAFMISLSCGQSDISLYEAYKLEKTDVASFRGDPHIYIVRVNDVPVDEAEELTSAGSARGREFGKNGRLIKVPPGEYEIEVAFLGWQQIHEDSKIETIKGELKAYEYTEAVGDYSGGWTQYFRSSANKTLTIKTEAGKNYVVKSSYSKVVYPDPETLIEYMGRVVPVQLEWDVWVEAVD